MKKALIVGINNYRPRALEGCEPDAKAISEVIKRNADGTKNFDVNLILSSKTPVTRSLLNEEVESLFSGDPEMALLYFAGHGMVKSTGGYLVTTDARKYDEGVEMDKILNIANQSGARNKIIILDCCHSGALGTPSFGGSTLAQLSEGLSVLTASRDSESALEVGGAGVFTSLIVEGLKGGAADLRGNISPGLLYAYVDAALGAWDQRPIFKTNVTSFASIRNVTPRVPLTSMLKITEFFDFHDSEHQLNPSYEDSDDSSDEENVKIFKVLQKLQSVGLVVPVGEEHMYYAAMHSKSCKLTVVGHQYWRLVKEDRL